MAHRTVQSKKVDPERGDPGGRGNQLTGRDESRPTRTNDMLLAAALAEARADVNAAVVATPLPSVVVVSLLLLLLQNRTQKQVRLDTATTQ